MQGSAAQQSATFTGGTNRPDGAVIDAAGNVLQDTNYYVYDAEGRITCAIPVISGGACSPTTGTHYAYNADGLRVAKYSGATLTTQYLHTLAGQPITELDGSGRLTRGEMYSNGLYLGSYDDTSKTPVALQRDYT